jgi:hypothetical protein
VAADRRSGSSPFVVVRNRILPRSAYRPAPLAELANTPAWWAALAALGGLIVAAGALLGVGAGEATAIGGVVLFLATAAVAGAERSELATALAVAAIVWTAAGISEAMRVDTAHVATAVGFVTAGALFVGGGLAGASRARATVPRSD